MHTPSLKKKQVRIYLEPEQETQFDKLVESIGSLSETALLTTLVAASLRCCVEAGYRMPLPLKFRIEEESAYGLNDAPRKIRTR